MTVGTFLATNFPTQDPATYKSAIDADFMVAKRFIDAFAPKPTSTSAMTVSIDPGFTYYGQTLTEVAAQVSTAIAASSLAGIVRIDRVVVDMITGAYSLVSGTSVAPAFPSGKLPVAQVALTNASIYVSATMLTDERVPAPISRTANYQEFTSSGAFTWNSPLGYSSNASVLLELFAGGGGGGTTSFGSMSGGGGGGNGQAVWFKLGQLTTAVAGVVGNGSTAGGDGANSNFGAYLTVYGGARASTSAATGGGGGGLFAAGSGQTGGAPLGGTGASPGTASNYGGGGGGNASGSTGGASVYGGGGGGGGNTGAVGGFGGASLYGGGGGGGGSTVTIGTGGVSAFAGSGGNGSTALGNAGTPGTAPAGGGGFNAAGATGACRVWVFPNA